MYKLLTPGFSSFLLKAIADVFNTPVYTMDVTNSASLGGCYRAKMGMSIS